MIKASHLVRLVHRLDWSLARHSVNSVRSFRPVRKGFVAFRSLCIPGSIISYVIRMLGDAWGCLGSLGVAWGRLGRTGCEPHNPTLDLIPFVVIIELNCSCG